jgi:hypothetical protein
MRRNAGETLRESIMQAADAAADRNEPIWAVVTDEPLQRVFCTPGPQLTGVVAVMVADRYQFSISDTDREGIQCVNVQIPREVFAIAESFMAGFVGALRANGVHGTYRKSGTAKEYRF